MTVHDALFTQAELAMGESVLIHAVGSGVGTAAVQLARAAGARTFGTSRTPAKLERARALGLDVGLEAPGFVDALRARTDGTGVDVTLDVIARPLEEKIQVTRAFVRHVNPLLAAGVARPIIDRVFALDEVAAAHAYMESDVSFGKVILTV